MLDAIILEKAGIPAVPIITDAFESTAKEMAELWGVPDFRFIMMPHPLASLTPDGIARRADEPLRLVLLNCLRYRPGVSDRATMGTPGKYTCCIAEYEEEHPWEPWHVERGFRPQQSTVTLIAASTMIQIWNYGDHEQLLRSAADALSFLGSIAILGRTPGALVIGGEHAEVLRASGWSKQRIREFIIAHTGRTIADLKRAGRIEGAVMPADEKAMHYALDTPNDLMLICAGSRIGALSMILPGFGSSKTAGRSPPVVVEQP